jgi:WD40 repeat protein
MVSRLHTARWKMMMTGIIFLLLTSCGRQVEETPSPIPPEVEDTPMVAPGATPFVQPEGTEPPIPGPEISPAIPFTMPTSPFQMPIDLVEFDPANISKLEPYGLLTMDMMPGYIPDASLAFSDFEYTLTAHLDDGEVIVWDISTGTLLATDWSKLGGGHTGSHAALAISPDYNGYVATSATVSLEGISDLQSAVYLWDADDLGEPIMLAGTSLYGDRALDPKGVMSVDYSPDGSLLAAGLRMGEGQGGMVRIWDMADNTLIQELTYADAVSGVAYLSDNRTVLVSAGNQVSFRESISGAELIGAVVDFTIDGMGLSPGDRWVAVWGEQFALLELATGANVLSISPVDEINKASFSKDGSLLAIVDGNSLRFWDIASGDELARFEAETKFLDVTFFNNDRMLATVDDQAQVLLWGVPGRMSLPVDLSTITPANASSLGRAAQLFVPKMDEMEFAGNSDWSALGSRDGVYVVEIPALTKIDFLPQVDRYSAVFSLSADGRWLAWVAEGGLVKVWDVSAGALAYELTELGEGCCRQIQLSPDGDILAMVDEMVGRVWDLEARQEVYSRDGVQGVELSPDGTRVAFESGRAIKVIIVDIASRQVIRELSGYSTAAPYYYTQFSQSWDKMFWAARANMQFTDVDSGQLGAEIPFSRGEFTLDGSQVAVVEDGWYYTTVGEVHLVDVDNGDTVRVFDHQEDEIVDTLTFSPDGTLLATALGDTIKVWDVALGTELTTLAEAGGEVRRLRFSPDGRILVSLAAGNLVDFWVVQGDEIATVPSISVRTAGFVQQINEIHVTESPTDAVVSPDGRWIAIAAQGGEIYLWDSLAEQLFPFPDFHNGWVYKVVFSRDGRWLASASQDGMVGLWDVDARQLVSSVSGSRGGELSSIIFHPITDVLIAGGERYTMIGWQIPSLKELWSAAGSSSNWTWDLAITINGRFIAIASANDKAYTRTLDDPNVKPGFQGGNIFAGHTSTVWSVDFSPDSRYLATGSWDGTVRLWNVTNGETIDVMEDHTDWVYDVAFSPDGMLLASASRDGTIRLWEVVSGEVLATLTGHTDKVWSVDFSPDGLLLISASEDGTVRIWGEPG